MTDKELKPWLTAAVALLLVCQFFMLTHAVSRNVNVWPVINAFDNDGANAIRVSESSNWLRDNGWYPYGNLYFNLSNMISQFDPLKAGRAVSKNDFLNDRGHHFALMMISLCSLYGIACLISLIITESTVWRLFSIFSIITVFLKNDFWVTWTLRAHPDLLLSFLIACAFYLTFRYMIQPGCFYLLASAVAWGGALAVKMTTLVFFPMLVFMFLPPLNRGACIKAVKYYILIAAAYLVVGFPQNFKVWKHLEHLQDQERFLLTPTINSVCEWFQLLFNQSAYAIGAIFFLVGCGILLGYTKKTDRMAFPLWRAGLMLGFPFAFFLTKNIVTVHEHYTLPIVAGLAVFSAFVALRCGRFLRGKAIESPMGRQGLTVALIVLVVLFARFTPNAVPDVLSRQLNGRFEASAFIESIASYQKQHKKILADPYVPWDENLGNVSVSYYRTLTDIQPGKAQVLLLSKGFYGRYLEEPLSDYVKVDARNWPDVCRFYRIFSKGDIVVDPYGQNWKRQVTSPQGWEIWVLQDALSAKKTR